jgi:hypothetical protein
VLIVIFQKFAKLDDFLENQWLSTCQDHMIGGVLQDLLNNSQQVF